MTSGVLAFGLVVVCSGTLVSGYLAPRKENYTDHACYRDCIGANPMVCEYDFIIEDYITMPRACYNCSDTPEDCFRPHCVTGDGRVRAVRTVNRMIPGPGIHVCKGDTLVVNVYNEMQLAEGITIHWHGIMQRGTPFMDGVPMVTQCPIPSYTNFQYNFTLHQTGSYFWHAHTGLHRADGVAGPLIIRETSETSAMSYYDEDLPEHTIIIQEWIPQMAATKYTKLNFGQGDDEPDAILLNGNAVAGELNTDSIFPVYVPYQTFKVTQGLRYRFRLISNGFVNCPFQVSVRSHKLLVVASDGFDIDPVEVDSVTIFAGERYDVVLDANQDVANYWIDVIGREDCEPNEAAQKAVLTYFGASEDLPEDTFIPSQSKGLHANTVSLDPNTVSVADMTSHHLPYAVSNPKDVKTFYMKVGFNVIPDPRYYDLEYYPLPYRKLSEYDDHYQHQLAMQVDDITYRSPSSPLLSQYDDVDEDSFCNQTSTSDCDKKLCDCTHRIKLAIDDVVDLVMYAHSGHGIHPMHLHGQSFFVLGMGELPVPVNRSVIEHLDRDGKLVRNLTNPILKDTIMVPENGYAIVRFTADNPGWWLFHCHNNIHAELGMSMLFQVGEPDEMSPTPMNFPRCGNWRWYDSSEDSAEHSDEDSNEHSDVDHHEDTEEYHYQYLDYYYKKRADVY